MNLTKLFATPAQDRVKLVSPAPPPHHHLPPPPPPVLKHPPPPPPLSPVISDQSLKRTGLPFWVRAARSKFNLKITVIPLMFIYDNGLIT